MRLKDVTFKYRKGGDVLNGVNLTIQDNNINFIIGPNGSGKSTIIDVLTKNVKPEGISGQVDFVKDNDYLYITQYLPMLGKVKCSEIANLVLGNIIGIRRVQLSNIEDRVDSRTFEMLGRVWNKTFNELSGGEGKLLQLLLFLQSNKSVVIMDEPSAFIDRRNVKEMFDIISHKTAQQTFIIVTHDIRDIRLVPEGHVCLIEDGRVQLEGNSASILSSINEDKYPFLYDFANL